MRAVLLPMLLASSSLFAQGPNYLGTSDRSVPPTATSPAEALTKPPQPAPPPESLSDDELRKFLIGTSWSWNGQRRGTTVNFLADGTVRHPSFTAKFAVKNAHEIELQLNGKIATLTFDPSYSHYRGIDFDGKWALQGDRVATPSNEVRPPAPESSESPPPGPATGELSRSALAPKTLDPIVGTWRWFNNMIVVVSADGRSTSPRGVGQWEFVRRDTVERQYIFTSPNLVWVDTLILSRDGNKLSGKNQKGISVSAERVKQPK